MVALGLADGMLTGNPKMTFWRHDTKSYSNFALDSHRMDFTGNVAFGGSPSVMLERAGDMAYYMYLRTELPGLGLSYAGAIVDPSLKVGGVAVEPYWTHAVGHAMIESAQIVIGTQCVDTIMGEFMYIWEELSGAPGKRLVEMTGKYDAVSALQIVSRQPRVLYTPLYFWFTMSSGLALPLVSLALHSVKVTIKLRPLAHLLKLTCAAMEAPYNFTLSDIQNRAKFSPSYYAGAPQGVGDLSALTSQSLTAQLMVTYVYLDAQERAQFANGAFEMLIPQHQHTETSVTQQVSTVSAVGNRQTVTMDVPFNHTVSELFWVARMGVHEEFSSVTTPCTSHFNEWFNFNGPLDFVTQIPLDPLVQVKLRLNNADRWEDEDAKYFRLVQPYQHHTNIPDKFLYCYSLALQPQDMVQPSGTVNLSRIDSCKMDFVVDGRLFYGPSQVGGTDGNSTVKLHLYALSWNSLRFRFGMGSARFAN